MTFHAFLPDPHVLTTPYVESSTTTDIELVAALDVSSYKTVALFLRVHSTFAGNGTLKLLAYPVWPFEPAIGARFQAGAVVDTATMDSTTTPGILLTAVAATIAVPALRIVAQIGTIGGDASVESVTISGGISLLAD
jgi:hypothetical protein